jgi:hypothetical protein
LVLLFSGRAGAVELTRYSTVTAKTARKARGHVSMMQCTAAQAKARRLPPHLSPCEPKEEHCGQWIERREQRSQSTEQRVSRGQGAKRIR